MSYNNSKRIQFGVNGKDNGPFSGGYVDNTQNLYLSETFAPYSRNTRLEGNSTIISPGYELLNELSTGTYPKGITYFNDGLIVVNDSKLYFIDVDTGDETEIVLNYILGVNAFDTTLSNWTAITDGSITYGTTNIPGLDFSSATSLSDVWDVIKDGINSTTSQTNTIVREEKTELVINGEEVVIASGTTGTDLKVMMGVDAYNGENVAALLQDTNRVYFQTIGNDLYIFSGDLGVANTARNLLKLNGLSIVNTIYSGSIPAGFQPAFGVVFNGCLWASGWSNNKNFVYKSVADVYDDFVSAGTDSLSFSETITGLSNNIEALFYFTKNTISVTGFSDITDTAGTATYTTRSLTVKEGAVNNGGIVEVGNKTFFVTPSNKIAMVTKGNSIDGFEVLELSSRKYAGIDEVMSKLGTDQSECFGYFLQEKNIVKWFFKLGTSSYNNICIIYDIAKDKFLVDNNRYFFDGISNGVDNYSVSMLDTKVYKDEYGQNNEGAIIPFELWTKEFYISDPTYNKIIWETRLLLDLNATTALYQYVYIDGILVDTKLLTIDLLYGNTIDGGSTSAIFTDTIDGGSTTADFTFTIDGGSAGLTEVYAIRTKGNLNKRGRRIQFRYKHNNLTGEVRLKGLSARIEVLPELTNNL